jgi:hypothetical protein
MIVWILGKVTEWPAWELQGVFSEEELAIKHGNYHDFYYPIEIDKPCPRETTVAPGIKWIMSKTAED